MNSCYFCKKATHVTEYCPEFDDLRSRYSEVIKRGQSNCLCPNYDPLSKDHTICKCKTLCPVCFQHHHIVLCPKRDLFHPSNPIMMPEPLMLFSHHSPFAKRFFELCNPIDQTKLRRCCKYFKNLQPISLTKLKPNYNTEMPTPPINTVLNNSGFFFDIDSIATLAFSTECFFYLDNIQLEKCFITKEDLKFLSQSDPHTVEIDWCQFDVQLEDIWDAFPYAIKFIYKTIEIIREDFILSFLNTQKNLSFKEIIVSTSQNVDLNIDDLVLFFEKHENTILTLNTAYMPYDSSFLDQLTNHVRFAQTDSKSYNLCLNFKPTKYQYLFQFCRFM